jgi:hypothetical protein
VVSGRRRWREHPITIGLLMMMRSISIPHSHPSIRVPSNPSSTNPTTESSSGSQSLISFRFISVKRAEEAGVLLILLPTTGLLTHRSILLACLPAWLSPNLASLQRSVPYRARRIVPNAMSFVGCSSVRCHSLPACLLCKDTDTMQTGGLD